MNYITNRDHISTAALYDPNYLSHGLSWGKHRYIRREGSPGNYRYFYPEDLREAGQNLVSGAKNLVSNAGNVASNIYRTVSGANKKEEVTRARVRRDVARVSASAAKNNANATQNEYVKTRFAAPGNPNTPFGGSLLKAHRARNAANDRLEVANESLKRAEIDYDNAVKEYKKTPMGLADSVKDFMRNKVGIGLKKEIKDLESVYARENTRGYDTSLTSEERRRANDSATRTWSALEKAYSNYGKTFLYSLPKISWSNGGPALTVKNTQYKIH